MDLVIRSLPLLLQGAQMTIQVMIFACSLSGFLGLLFGMLTSERLRLPILSYPIEGFAFLFRAIPFYVQLLIVYFVLPDLCGFNLDPFTASALALGLCSSGYVTQIVRSALNAVPSTQWDAAFVLGYSKWGSLRAFILPQMIRHALPALCNEWESVLKSTAIVSSIGLLELTRVGMNLVSREMEPVPIYLMIACCYLLFSFILNAFFRLIEWRLNYVRN